MPGAARPVRGEVIELWVRVLGSAAGGGFPQWNCACPPCDAVRTGSRPARPRTQSSIAVSPDHRRWFLLNASPDVHAQIERSPALRPSAGRAVPLEAVLLTDAELDHTLGLLLLREGRGLRLHCTEAVYEALHDVNSLLRTLETYCPVTWHPVVPGDDVALCDGLSYRAFDVPTTKRARFGPDDAPGRVVGYRLSGEDGRSVVYLPGVQELTPGVLEAVDGCDCLLVDGTCWSDDELIRLGLAARTSRDMGHMPIGGPDGSLARLSSPPAARRTLYLHINNTNPILIEDSPERRAVESHGMEVAVDGMELRI